MLSRTHSPVRNYCRSAATTLSAQSRVSNSYCARRLVPRRFPRRTMRHPTRDVALVEPILLSESMFQNRLLQQRNIDQIDDEEEAEPTQQATGTHHEDLGEQNKQYPTNHRIADIAVHALDDEPPWRVPRRQCPAPTPSKTNHCRDEQRKAKQESGCTSYESQRSKRADVDCNVARRVRPGRPVTSTYQWSGLNV